MDNRIKSGHNAFIGKIELEVVDWDGNSQEEMMAVCCGGIVGCSGARSNLSGCDHYRTSCEIPGYCMDPEVVASIEIVKYIRCNGMGPGCQYFVAVDCMHQTLCQHAARGHCRPWICTHPDVQDRQNELDVETIDLTI